MSLLNWTPKLQYKDTRARTKRELQDDFGSVAIEVRTPFIHIVSGVLVTSGHRESSCNLAQSFFSCLYVFVCDIYRVPNDHEHAQANKFKSVVELKNMVA